MKISVSKDYGIVIRKAALREKEVETSKVLEVMETTEPLGESDELLSFGPHFGGEASYELSKRLDSLGLTRKRDYFVFYGDFPDWVGFYVCEK
ncbi:hypothetical protein [Microbulbifer discodermiae]|uniref:hypothetical protein n=1 Tax=Microbulbifer sp. 2201CG32-9 TaxID=3232309 RepID=UPI00345C102D